MIYAIEQISPRVLSVVFREEISETVHEQVLRVTDLFQGRFPGLIEDVVPSYHQVTLFFTKPMVSNALRDWVYEEIRSDLHEPGQEPKSRIITVPVSYGGTFGPDLEEVARYLQLPSEEVIRLHMNADYTVYMLGFLPGFPYLGGMDPALSIPRKTTPRQRVFAGSVGIAGGQTGVYPSPSPGGWQLIGRTPLSLVDVTKEEPCLFRPGDRIRFEAISETDFQRLSEGE
ncbi:5-oxoprolinase subunit PxpB [Salisediminibacterium selenitireducens]|uniref:Allophanate hydrolase subunit 1 n=1 Tax=Bacillus selenitireducens (strain ATCC 700615 / DSM 15326 / MLS10) TaxID=439292 RepID=D6Y0B3_BACIE|nr:5-oxoprolinase subunit PxpB [Salisediminibacterium selenitireducens]ADH98504.1 Allophanate hydrolase subunit 1 [[Bacillus] selenitireducens MLS10]